MAPGGTGQPRRASVATCGVRSQKTEFPYRHFTRVRRANESQLRGRRACKCGLLSYDAHEVTTQHAGAASDRGSIPVPLFFCLFLFPFFARDETDFIRIRIVFVWSGTEDAV